MIIQNINTQSSGSRLLQLQVGKKQETDKYQKYQKKENLKKQLLNTIQLQKKSSLQQLKVNQNYPQNPLQNSHSHDKSKIVSKSNSQPRIRTFKQQILRIPKVKQILQKDKFIYQQDIQKRLQLIGDVKNQNYTQEEIFELKQLHKPVTQQAKKIRRHKTNYKIPLTRKNIQSLNNLIEKHINHNQHFKNQKFIFLSEKDYKEPFDLKKLKFMDQINPLKKKYKQKFPTFKQGVLEKNKLLLEHVILNRNLKREMKLDQKKKVKQSKLTNQLIKTSQILLKKQVKI